MRILDPFAGSGAVSRLARYLGYQVAANDWEPYAQIVNRAHLEIGKTEAESFFQDKGGLKEVFRYLNNLSGEAPAYMSRYYAPQVTDTADYRIERLFFTAENGRFIDRVRHQIEEWFPGEQQGRARKEKDLLLSSLIYEVSTHSNTNGVFKAFHKGFGGHGKDALSRIMKPMELEVPYLVDNSRESRVYGLDAQDFVRQVSGDVCYLDPPYNSHQYGSNYHILNTVALWDKPKVPLTLTEEGRLKEKAGIRKDWIKTKSEFCYKKTAPGAFDRLLEGIDSRYILLSYNTEGIIPFEQLFDSLNSQGKTDLYLKDYILYRGGRQSLQRKNHNMEILFVVDRKEKPGKYDKEEIDRFLLERSLLQTLRNPLVPARVEEAFPPADGGTRQIHPKLEPIKCVLGYRFTEGPAGLDRLNVEDLQELFKIVEQVSCQNHQEECGVLTDLLLQGVTPAHEKTLQRRLVQVLRKFAFKKYREIFEETLVGLRKDFNGSKWRALQEQFDQIAAIAELRFEG